MSIDHYSVSSVTTAMGCPRQWWCKYQLKMDAPAGEAASFGSQFDQMVSKRLGCKIHKDDKPGSPVEGVEEAVAGYLSQPWAMKSATDAQMPINISPGQWGVIAEMNGLYSEIQRPIIGFIDLFDAANRVVVDLKTSSSKRTSENWALQVLIYSIAKQASEAKIHLMTRTKVPAYYEFMIPINPRSTKWAVQLMSYWIANIERWLKDGAGDELPRTPGFYCSWCPEALECPAQSLILGG